MYSLSPASASDFDAYALTHPRGNYHQTAQMASFRTALGWDCHLLFLNKDDVAVGAALLAGKKGRYEVTVGPLLDFTNTDDVEAFLKSVNSYVKLIGGHTVEVFPYEVYQTRASNGTIDTKAQNGVIDTFTNAGWRHKGFTVEYEPAANRWVFIKDLTHISDEKQLLSSYRQTTRQTINKLVKQDYTVKKLGFDELAVTKKLIDSSNDRNSINLRSLEYYQHLYTEFDDNVEFLVVYHKETTPISTGIFVHHPNELVYFASGTDSTYRQLYGAHFLQHHVMTKAIADGVKRYNFYGISGHFERNSLLVYKSGFRGYIEEYVGGFTYVVNPSKALLSKAIRAPRALARRILK
jgi:lipid II:glycine glycyltransferase (peptidoglycan interpeptide bridge formation enzyme)